MRWWQVTVQVPEVTADAMAALLNEWPEVKGVAMEGMGLTSAPHPEYGEWLDDSLLGSGDVTVRAYVPEYVERESLVQRLAQLREQVQAADLPVMAEGDWQLELFDESSWENAWKDQFEPIPVGQRLLIVPKWEIKDEQDGDRLPIILEPGMAFGTGTHATTRLCLEALENSLLDGKRVLDIGCGTAVLAIAAARLGASEVAAIDIDPVAVQVARANVADNGVDGVVHVEEGDLLSRVEDSGYQVAVANILRDPVISLTPDAYVKLAKGGRFIVSGFIVSQEPAVQDALTKAGFTVTERLQEEDWVALVAEKAS